jgi:hypothetical protein
MQDAQIGSYDMILSTTLESNKSLNGNRAVFPCGFGCLSHVSPSVEMAIGAEGTS